MKTISKINILILYSIINIFFNNTYAEEKFPNFIPDNKKLIGFKVNSNFLIEELYTEDRKTEDYLYYSHCIAKINNIDKEYEFQKKICINENKKNTNFSNNYQFNDVKNNFLNYKINRKLKSFSIFPYREKLKLEYEYNQYKDKELFIYTSVDLKTGNTLNSKKFIFSNN